eukprot:scaffold3070_cov1604-Pavlova_lutheri.AAC.5
MADMSGLGSDEAIRGGSSPSIRSASGYVAQGQSVGLLTRGSQVRPLPYPIAQLRHRRGIE